MDMTLFANLMSLFCNKVKEPGNYFQKSKKAENLKKKDPDPFEEHVCSRSSGSQLFTALVGINKTKYQYNDSPV